MTQVPDEVADWIVAGRDDIALFAWRGFGIRLHAIQVLAAQNILSRVAAYILLWWANRAGKTALVAILHFHALFYKIGIAPPEDEADYRKRWLPASYRTLHCSPLNRLTLKAYNEMGEMLRGLSESQWDSETKHYREAPLAPFFTLAKERNVTGSDDIILRCENGACCDFFSTEGGAARIEGSAWWLITWDELWATEGDVENIRWILFNRLTARAADHDATIVLTGTITEDTEHLAKEWIANCEDKSNLDWWGCGCPRSMNPRTSGKSLDRAFRNLTEEDRARSVEGRPGGVRGRLLIAQLVDHAFDHGLPDWTPPTEKDGTTYVAGRRQSREDSPWLYLLTCDIAIAEADNVFSMWRLPKNGEFSVSSPIIGVRQKVVPGSRTLTDDDIVLTIEETYLPYGGQIYIDTTDAFGKNVQRKLVRKGYPAHEFDYHATTARGDYWKDAGELALREFLAEQDEVLTVEQALAGKHDEDGVPVIDRTKSYGCLWIPKGWTKHYDQMSVLKPPPDDRKQHKDAAMTVVMLAFIAKRLRPRKIVVPKRFVVFGGR